MTVKLRRKPMLGFTFRGALVACLVAAPYQAFAQSGATFDFEAAFRTTRGIDRTVEATRGGFIVVPETAPFVDMSEEDAVLFGRNDAELSSGAMAILDKLGASAMQGSLSGFNLQVEGHTCSLGPSEYNLELSRRRAQMVTGYLVGQSKVPRDRIRIVGYGETRPAHGNLDPTDQAKNRRVRIVRLERSDGQRVATVGEMEEARARAITRGIAGNLVQAELWGMERGGGRLRRLGNGDSLGAGGLLKVRLHVFEGCHVFVFIHGSSGKVDFLLPDASDENAAYGRWLDRTEFTSSMSGGFSLPAADQSYVLDGTAGTETIFVLAGRHAPSNFDGLPQRIANAAREGGGGGELFPDFDEFYQFKINHTGG